MNIKSNNMKNPNTNPKTNTNSSKVRINKFDNLKGLAIILIVLGHVLIVNTKSLDCLRNFIYLFDLPLFFFVSGYFSKIAPGEIKKSFKRLIIPYILFCILLRIYLLVLFPEDKSGILFINPEFGMWFLISLFSMKLLLPLFDKLKYPVFISFIIALAIGFIPIDGTLLGITRTFGYLPVFLTGFYYKKHNSLKNNKSLLNNKIIQSKTFIIILTLLTLLISIIIAYKFKFVTINLATAYKSQNIYIIKDVVKKAIVIVIEIIAVLLLNKLMTNKKTFLTKIGANSMAIYVLHLWSFLFTYRMIKPMLIANNLNTPLIYLVYAISITIILVYVLSRDIISEYLNKIINSINSLIFRESA